jgi:hypothetical protein
MNIITPVLNKINIRTSKYLDAVTLNPIIILILKLPDASFRRTLSINSAFSFRMFYRKIVLCEKARRFCVISKFLAVKTFYVIQHFMLIRTKLSATNQSAAMDDHKNSNSELLNNSANQNKPIPLFSKNY